MTDKIKWIGPIMYPSDGKTFADIADDYKRSLYDPENENVMGSLAYQWSDKKHRHVDDLCRLLRGAQSELDAVKAENARLREALRPIVEQDTDVGALRLIVHPSVVRRARAALEGRDEK